MLTRVAERGEPNSVFAASNVFYNSFLPKTIRDLRVHS
jgi:MFS-type transporter involved in bile tolerance (Atg22 family)